MYANKLGPETAFFLYLLEQYARYRGRTAAAVLADWDAEGLTKYVRANYDIYHQEALTNAFDDIDAMAAGITRPGK
jgi:hypothetical protein